LYESNILIKLEDENLFSNLTSQKVRRIFF
jgi:hypothetical protein